MISPSSSDYHPSLFPSLGFCGSAWFYASPPLPVTQPLALLQVDDLSFGFLMSRTAAAASPSPLLSPLRCGPGTFSRNFKRCLIIYVIGRSCRLCSTAGGGMPPEGSTSGGSLLLLLHLLVIGKECSCLSHLSLNVPFTVARGSSVALKARFALDNAAESLESVIWYRNDEEFVRLIVVRPDGNGHMDIYTDRPGVPIDKYRTVLRDGLCEVVLKNVPFESTGRYRVEVNTALPFPSQMSTEEVMVVVVPPRDGPSITGGIEDTKEGPFLDMMCVSGRSTPAAQLQWFINGKPVNPQLDVMRYPVDVDREGLQQSRLQLRILLDARKHFRRGKGHRIRVRCVATLRDGFELFDDRVFHQRGPDPNDIEAQEVLHTHPNPSDSAGRERGGDQLNDNKKSVILAGKAAASSTTGLNGQSSLLLVVNLLMCIFLRLYNTKNYI
ncbi:uncharacterized protein LOC111247364 [Varroa destructor]|uniref:Ig-like domain-containing protein n=1 Tax=Varroa destructor TaxID=109461 RepID=A0A7M7JL87_VARDE|nr:uncharacterized protein LOC111247364 [Varroa destructor]